MKGVVTEPLITFYEAIMRPEWFRLESGLPEAVAETSERTSAASSGRTSKPCAVTSPFTLALGSSIAPAKSVPVS